MDFKYDNNAKYLRFKFVILNNSIISLRNIVIYRIHSFQKLQPIEKHNFLYKGQISTKFLGKFYRYQVILLINQILVSPKLHTDVKNLSAKLKTCDK